MYLIERKIINDQYTDCLIFCATKIAFTNTPISNACLGFFYIQLFIAHIRLKIFNARSTPSLALLHTVHIQIHYPLKTISQSNVHCVAKQFYNPFAKANLSSDVDQAVSSSVPELN